MSMLVLLLLLVLQGGAADSRVFGCDGPFTADLTEARLVSIYGAANVSSGDVDVGMRLRPDPWTRAVRQVIGDRDFSSGHPAMQALNPRAYELLLLFDPPSTRKQD